MAIEDIGETVGPIKPSDPFVYGGVLINPHELFERYANSEFGQDHALQTPRYAQVDNGYSYGDRDRFIAELGDDVHPVRHMLHTHDEIAVPFLNAQRTDLDAEQFTEEQEGEIRVTSVLHDTGECTSPKLQVHFDFPLVGDLRYGTMPIGHKDKERQVRNFLYGVLYPDVPAELLRRVDELDFKESDDIACEAFDVIERIGYFQRSVRASELIIAEGDTMEDVHRIAQLGRLAVFVGENHRRVLWSKRHRFPYVRQFFERFLEQDVV